MDVLSFLMFFIYAAVILLILLYISPILSAITMIVLPIFSVFLLPGHAIPFFSTEQFSFLDGTLPVYNIHILLMLWSALTGVIVYTEILSWYLLRKPRPSYEPQEPETEKKSGAKRVNLKEFVNIVWKTLKDNKQ